MIEVPLYGSSRLGVWRPDREVETTGWELFDTDPMMGTGGGIVGGWERGRVQFELSNHLGNVLVTISDARTAVDDGTYEVFTICHTCLPGIPCVPCFNEYVKQNSTPDGVVDYYLPQVLTANDYYPFGMGMPGRKFAEGNYRYGFNGQEKSTEIDPNGNSMTAEFWQYDARLGRRWNLDPRPSIEISSYATFVNNPIWNSDPLGDTIIKRPDGYYGEEIPNFAVVNSLSKPGNVIGTNVPAPHSEGAVESFTIGKRKFTAHYRTSDGVFTGYKSGDIYYNWNLYRDVINTIGDYDLAGSLINFGYEPEKLLDIAQKVVAFQEFANRSPIKDFFKGIANDFVITAKTMMSGPLGYSKSSVTDLDGNTVGYNRRMSAGVSAFSSFVPMSGAPKGLNFMYSVGGYRIFGTKYFRLDSRLTSIGLEGFGHRQFDAAHRGAAFVRDEVLRKGTIGFRDPSTIFFNHSIGGRSFSVGINPWTRKIFHEGPGAMK